MSCTGKYLKTFYKGVEIKKDQSCVGDKHLYTTETNLSNPTYEWTLDTIHGFGAPILSTESSFLYTFINKEHKLYCAAHDDGSCGVTHILYVTGIICSPPCPIACVKETVDVGPGFINYLTSHFGNLYNFARGYAFECAPRTSKINDDTCAWIQDYLKGLPHCSQAPIKVYWEYNANRRNCIKLVILNSPLKFTQIMVDGTVYNFNTNEC